MRPSANTGPVWTRTPGSARARFGLARSLAATSKLHDALDAALTAVAAAPRDGEIHALIGDIYERLHRFAQAANAYRNYINLLPNKDRSEKAAWARAQVEFLDSFGDIGPVDIDAEDLEMLHTLPFRLQAGQDHRAGARQRRTPAGLHPRHRLRRDGAVPGDGAARAYSSCDLHAERRRGRSGSSRPSTGPGQVARLRHAAGAQSTGADQEPRPARYP